MSEKAPEFVSFEESMKRLSEDECFKTTVYAMNTLLHEKGIYSPEEFEWNFRNRAAIILKNRDKLEADIAEAKTKVYSRTECVFCYCDAPDICQPADQCRYEPPVEEKEL